MTLAFTAPNRSASVWSAATHYAAEDCSGAASATLPSPGLSATATYQTWAAEGSVVIAMTDAEIHILKTNGDYTSQETFIAAVGSIAADKKDAWTYTTPTKAGSICAKLTGVAGSFNLTTTTWAVPSSTGNATITTENTNDTNSTNDTSGAKTMGAAFAAAALAVAATQF